MTATVSPQNNLGDLIREHRVIVCVGAGGVGKTTVAAALSLAAARSGKRTLCLTIDPARRLAESLGLSAFPKEEMRVPRGFLSEHGVQLSAELSVMMLDAQATFDGLIRKFSSSSADAERIISHHVYQHLAANLAGTQSYMAMEKVLSVLDDEQYDLIVLDTPPSARALDFFDAPRKMSEILDSPATRALVSAFDRGKKLRFGFLGAGLRRALQGLERVTGSTLIGDVAELLGDMNSLFGGFARRAAEVDRRLREQEFGYLLVTSPDPRTLDDARSLKKRMAERDLHLDALAFNRVAQPGLSDATDADVASLQTVSEQGRAVMVRLAQEQELARREQTKRCDGLLSEFPSPPVHVLLPAFAEDVHHPTNLMRVAARIAPDTRAEGPH